MFSLPGVTPYVPVSPNPLSARPGALPGTGRAGGGHSGKRSGVAGSVPRGSPALAGALEAGEERRGEAGRGRSSAPSASQSQHRRAVPQATVARGSLSHRDLQLKGFVGDGSCSPVGMARGCFILIAAPGRGWEVSAVVF